MWPGRAETFWDLLRRIAAAAPNHEAIVRGADRMTFGAWHARAAAYAAWFHSRGVGRGTRVALWMEASPEYAAALFGVWGAGGVPVLLDVKVRASHFLHALATVSPALVLREAGLSLPAESPVADVVTDDVDASHLPAAPCPLSLPTDPASIVFTSGSTGLPKGVTQSHGALVRGCRAVTGYLGIGGDDRLLCPIPWAFDYGYGQLLTTAMTGATQVIPEAPNPFAVTEAVERERPTILAGLPSVFAFLLRGLSPLPKVDLSSIRTVTNTGGTVPRPILDEVRRLFGHARLFLNYGLTETYRTACLDPALVATHPTSIGRPIPGVDVVIVREDGSAADTGEEGEIVHRGDYICLGYWNDSASTARAIRPDPLAVPGVPDAGRAFFTGDIGVIDEAGLLYFRGRRDALLKPMGVRVSPPEIEAHFYDSGLVSEIAVVGRKHDYLGDEVWAFVVPNAAGDDQTTRLREHARRTMSPYMAPQRYVIVEALPRTVSGKVDYPALRVDAERRASESVLP